MFTLFAANFIEFPKDGSAHRNNTCNYWFFERVLSIILDNAESFIIWKREFIGDTVKHILCISFLEIAKWQSALHIIQYTFECGPLLLPSFADSIKGKVPILHHLCNRLVSIFTKFWISARWVFIRGQLNCVIFMYVIWV